MVFLYLLNKVKDSCGSDLDDWNIETLKHITYLFISLFILEMVQHIGTGSYHQTCVENASVFKRQTHRWVTWVHKQ